jgi:thimet oligopeptidase
MSKLPKMLVCSLVFVLTATNICLAAKSPMLDKNGALHFDITPAEISQIGIQAKADFETAINKLIAIPANKRTFKNTVVAFDNATIDYGQPSWVCSLYANVLPDKSLRDACITYRDAVSKYFVDIYTNKDIYNALKEYSDKGKKLPKVEARLLKNMLLDFERNGLALSPADLRKYKALSAQLIDLKSKVAKRLNQEVGRIEATLEELDGMTQTFIDSLDKTKDGKYIVTTSRGLHYYPFQENATNVEARKRLEMAYHNRAHPYVTRLLEQAIVVRQKIAKLLGYKNWADYKLEMRMAKNAETAHGFLLSMVDNIRPKGLYEMGKALELKRKGTGNYAEDKLYAWDIRYWMNQYKKDKTKIDMEKVKEYLPTEHVLKEMLKIAGELYGVKFVKANVPLWYPDVYAYKMIRNGKIAAYFYLDIYPRKGKYQHAQCAGPFDSRLLPDGTWQKPVSIIVMNVTKPTKNTPALLNYEQYTTLFHETGHALHGILSKVKYGSISGTSTARDFVEVPSTLFELMSITPEVLNRTSRHYKTGKKLPANIINKLASIKKVDSGLHYLWLLQRGMFDMLCHTANKPVNTTKIEEHVFQNIRMFPMTKGTHPQASFGHTMRGYDAQYYSYLWSDVIASDFLNYFKTHGGVLHPRNGRRYRDFILEVGGMYDEAEQVKKFLGRPFSNKAFLREIGVVPNFK